MSSPAPCFESLSRDQLAHVARCQRAALDRRLSVVSSGVFAAEAGPELAGCFFWLVASPTAARFELVWRCGGEIRNGRLYGGRLLCGCKRRRSDGALTCAHAQCVRLFLLAAAGVRVPSSVPAGVSAPATPAPADPAPVAPVAPVAPADVAPEVGPELAKCPHCDQDTPRDVLITFGVCADCLDLIAQAERQPRATRCSMFECNELAIGETVSGLFCARHLARSRRTLAAIAERRRLDEEADRVNWTIDFGDEDESEAREEDARAALRDDEALAEAIAAD